jgi:hypothetical protein
MTSDPRHELSSKLGVSRRLAAIAYLMALHWVERWTKARKGIRRRQFGTGMAPGLRLRAATAQRRRGVPAAPDATTTIDGR